MIKTEKLQLRIFPLIYKSKKEEKPPAEPSKRIFIWTILIVILVSCDFWASQPPSSRERDRQNIERIIHNLTSWTLNKDFNRLEEILSHDTLFCFQPSSRGTMKSWEDFAKLYDFWKDNRFRANRYEIKDLRIELSRKGDVAWCSAILKDTRWTAVLEKQDGLWMFVQMHYSSAQDKVLEKAGLRQGPWLGQSLPGKDAVPFAPGLVSSEEIELNSVFSPDGTEFYFCRIGPIGPVVYRTIRANGFWTPPEPFIPGGIDITLSPDGQRMYYCSRYPHPGDQKVKADHDIWVRERNNDGWGPARPLAAELNSEQDEFYPMATSSGNLYFCRRRVEGDNTLYRSEIRNGTVTPPEKLPSAINSGHKDSDPYISPDEAILIFNSNRPGGYGGDDLYISFRDDQGKWSLAQNLGPSVNTPADEFCAMLPPGGKQLMFTRSVSNDKNRPNWDIFWIDAGFLQTFQISETTDPSEKENR